MHARPLRSLQDLVTLRCTRNGFTSSKVHDTMVCTSLPSCGRLESTPPSLQLYTDASLHVVVTKEHNSCSMRSSAAHTRTEHFRERSTQCSCSVSVVSLTVDLSVLPQEYAHALTRLISERVTAFRVRRCGVWLSVLARP